MSRQPSFTLSEWTDAQEDLLDIDPVPQTPVFEIGADTKSEGDAVTLTVTPVGLQERLEEATVGFKDIIVFQLGKHTVLCLTQEGLQCFPDLGHVYAGLH